MTSILRIASLLLAALVVMVSPALGADKSDLVWHTSVDDAWQATCRGGRPLLVFVTRDDCFYCTQMKDRTYASPAVAGTIKSSFVPLVLDGTTPSPLLRDLKVTLYPATFVISPQAVVLARFDGYVPPETLASRLDRLRRPLTPVSVAPAR